MAIRSTRRLCTYMIFCETACCAGKVRPSRTVAVCRPKAAAVWTTRTPMEAVGPGIRACCPGPVAVACFRSCLGSVMVGWPSLWKKTKKKKHGYYHVSRSIANVARRSDQLVILYIYIYINIHKHIIIKPRDTTAIAGAIGPGLWTNSSSMVSGNSMVFEKVQKLYVKKKMLENIDSIPESVTGRVHLQR